MALCDQVLETSTVFARLICAVECISPSVFLLPNTIPLYGHTTLYLPTHQLRGFVSFPLPASLDECCYDHLCTSFCVVMFSFLLGIYLGVELLGHIVQYSIFNVLKNYQTVSQSSCTIILHSHQQCIMVPITSQPYQCFLLSFLAQLP